MARDGSPYRNPEELVYRNGDYYDDHDHDRDRDRRQSNVRGHYDRDQRGRYASTAIVR